MRGVPDWILVPARRRLFAEAGEAKGNARKTTGSYYTPDSLVQALLDSALDPVLDRVEAEADDPVKALLSVTVIDPACDSASYRRYGGVGPLTTGDMQWYWQQFAGHQPDQDDTRIAPLRCDPIGLPPTHIVTAELDPARLAGMKTLLCVRPGNHPQPLTHTHTSIHSFAEITR